MKPIICPKCQTEVLPHETKRERFEDAFSYITGLDFHYEVVPNLSDQQIKIFEIYYNNLCLDERMEFINKNQQLRTKEIQSGKMEIVRQINKNKYDKQN